MNTAQFYAGLSGASDYAEGSQTRLRHLVADQLDILAHEARTKNRPDRSGLLLYISGCCRNGITPSKKSIRKAQREIDEARRRLVRR